jgi:hypothetical protein
MTWSLVMWTIELLYNSLFLHDILGLIRFYAIKNTNKNLSPFLYHKTFKLLKVTKIRTKNKRLHDLVESEVTTFAGIATN